MEMSKLTFAVLVIFMFMLQGLTAAEEVAQESLVGYWPFDEGTGIGAKDVSGNGNDGEFFGEPKWVDGVYGKALDFGGESYVIVPDSESLDITDTLSIMAWFKVNGALATDPCTSRMISKNNSYHIHFDFGGDPQALEFLVKPDNAFVESQTINWELGKWYHFAGIFDNGTIRLYINGVLEGETQDATGIEPSDLDLWIGGDDWQPCFFPGMIDEVRIYSKSLTEAEVNLVMKGPADTSAVQAVNRLPITWGTIKYK